ncbi:hypothetical protein VNO77_20561 [Canavalia gladiata]|uniref:Uncharacterized protein n=1 Tax=Canavalia gladiata TaxID=3824 RepID=A0AAN9QJG6_CANGL
MEERECIYPWILVEEYYSPLERVSILQIKKSSLLELDGFCSGFYFYIEHNLCFSYVWSCHKFSLLTQDKQQENTSMMGCARPCPSLFDHAANLSSLKYGHTLPFTTISKSDLTFSVARSSMGVLCILSIDILSL